jgi:hypothetical protein
LRHRHKTAARAPALAWTSAGLSAWLVVMTLVLRARWRRRTKPAQG